MCCFLKCNPSTFYCCYYYYDFLKKKMGDGSLVTDKLGFVIFDIKIDKKIKINVDFPFNVQSLLVQKSTNKVYKKSIIFIKK